MAKVTYDVSDVEDIQEGLHAPVGMYRGKVRSCEPKDSSKGNKMLEVIFDLTHDGAGKKLKEAFLPLWYYPIMDHEHPFVQGRWKEFIRALGLKPKGTLDTNKIVGQSLQLKLKSDTDQDGDYRPKIAKVMSLAPEDEPEEPEEEPEPEEEAGDEVNLDELDRNALKKFIKEEDLGSLADLGINTKTTDEEIRTIIVDKLGGDEEPEPEDEPEEPEEEPEPEEEAEEPADGDGYDAMSNDELKAELKSRELPIGGTMAVKIARLRKDDSDEPF